MKKVMAIFGSPRKQGNSATLVDDVLNEFNKEKTEIKKYFLTDMRIESCRACLYCKTNENCVIKDDMADILNNFESTDVIVMGAPIYLMQVSGQVKQFFDRLYPLLVMSDGKFSHKYPSKDTVMIYAQGNADTRIFQDYITATNKMLGLLGLNVIKTLICGSFNMIAIEENVSSRTEAKNIGKLLATR
jgi:multimeric flavodoxin WrbA